MVTTCVAVGCNNRQDKTSERSFYRFPTDPERRQKWVAAMKRDNWHPSNTSRVCSDHFISRKKSDDCLSPDYIPSQFEHTQSPHKRKAKQALKSFERRAFSKKRRSTQATRTQAAQALLSLSRSDDHSSETETGSEGEEQNTASISVQTELSVSDIDSLHMECQTLRNKNIKLREELRNIALDETSLKDNDKKVTVLTGLPSYQTLMCIYNLISNVLKPTNTLTAFQQLFVTLMRLRFNLNIQYIAFIFGIHPSTVSRVFNNVVDILFAKLVPTTICWPERADLRKTIPMCFKRTFPKCVCIIDCFEIFIERPSDLKARAQTYSNYKSHNTAKYLIGISPQGIITFISKGFGGRASDKFITEQSGFLNKLLPGDTVLADRGFDIKDTLGIYGATLEIPAFTKGKTQLDSVDVEKTRNIASVRIHVERVIGLTRQKYTMLEGTVPITLLQPDTACDITTLDKIVHVSCALVNTCESVIPFN